jgi:hypothetical protein
MRTLAPFLAQLSDELGPRKFKMSPSSRDVVLVMGAALLVSILALLWAVFLRKKRRHHHRSELHDHSLSTPAKTQPALAQTGNSGNPGTSSHAHHKRRRRRRKERPRNPTLAETGGLPPIRSEGPLEPPP